jgi:hypothetical protein
MRKEETIEITPLLELLPQDEKRFALVEGGQIEI